MSWLAWAIAISAVVVAATAAMGALAWRTTDDAGRRLVKRIYRLPFRMKLRLAGALFRDRRIPVAVRFIPPALILYLGMPIDLVPDFIPLLGQLDDVVIVVVGVGLLFRFTRREVLDEHVAALEPGWKPGTAPS
jgi:uncharacterized membrane protein YkvA (DUF1232 family)